jgi:hypothetical protein
VFRSCVYHLCASSALDSTIPCLILNSLYDYIPQQPVI